MKRTEENLQYLRDKYSCRHYIKHIQNRGYLYCNELTFLLSIIDLEELNEKQIKQLFKTHRAIIKTIKSYQDNGISPHKI
jgi:hypothetical protein